LVYRNSGHSITAAQVRHTNTDMA